MTLRRFLTWAVVLLSLVAVSCNPRAKPRKVGGEREAVEEFAPALVAHVPAEKAGRFVAAKARARITVEGKSYRLFEGRTYPLLDVRDGSYVVDYYGKSGTIPKASAWRLEDAARHYVERDKGNVLTFPAAAAGHVAVALGDSRMAQIWYSLAL